MKQSEESSEVASDEEYGLSPASGDVPMDMGNATVCVRERFFTEDDPTMVENIEGPPRCDIAEMDVTVEEYLGADKIKGQGCNTYMQLLRTDEYSEQRSVSGVWYPFACHEEWQVFRWLSSLRVSMDQVDKFFGLDYVSLLLSTLGL